MTTSELVRNLEETESLRHAHPRVIESTLYLNGQRTITFDDQQLLFWKCESTVLTITNLKAIYDYALSESRQVKD
ncbi:hypothetical protein [Levilactobacillus paucivorans]|uniref:hypothetical protein n=1 Tax=Levilactobacillus paucivorans TaxID=616990 RepID=UPI0007103DFE|nr:hypothetical protein [Levilactobacillus paucivorans]